MVQLLPDGGRRSKSSPSAALKTAAMQVREKGFKVQVAAKETTLPVYDSFRDPYCPWARALEHNIWQDRRAGALLEGAAPQEAAKTAHAETAQRLQPLRERFINDRWTLPTMPTPANPAAAAAAAAAADANTRNKPSESTGLQYTHQNEIPAWRPTMEGAAVGSTHETTQGVATSPMSSSKPMAGGADDAPLKLTWQESLESEVELACLHAVVARESLLADIRQALGLPPLDADSSYAPTANASADLHQTGVNLPKQAVFDDVVGDSGRAAPPVVLGNMLGALREATLRVIVAIQDWREHVRREEEAVLFRAAAAGSASGRKNRPKANTKAVKTSAKAAATTKAKTSAGTANTASANTSTPLGAAIDSSADTSSGSSNLDRPFLYKRENYLLRLVSDGDFLAESPVARAALGYRRSRGPDDSSNTSSRTGCRTGSRDGNSGSATSTVVGAGCGVDPRGNPLLNPAGGLVQRMAAEREKDKPLSREDGHAEGRAARLAFLETLRSNEAAAMARPGGKLAPIADGGRLRAAELVLMAEAKRYAPALLRFVNTQQQRHEQGAAAAADSMSDNHGSNAVSGAGSGPSSVEAGAIFATYASGEHTIINHDRSNSNMESNFEGSCCLPQLKPSSPLGANKPKMAVVRSPRPWTASRRGPRAAADAAAQRAASLAQECSERAQGIAEAEAELAILVQAEASHRATAAAHARTLQALVRSHPGMGQGHKRARSVAARKQAAEAAAENTAHAVRTARAALCLEALELDRVTRLRREKAKLARELADATSSGAAAAPERTRGAAAGESNATEQSVSTTSTGTTEAPNAATTTLQHTQMPLADEPPGESQWGSAQ